MKKIALALALITLTACGKCGTDSVPTPQGRFEVLNNFKVFDDTETGYIYKTSEGKTVRDRVTGECYLFVWQGDTRGGPAYIPTGCP